MLVLTRELSPIQTINIVFRLKKPSNESANWMTPYRTNISMESASVL